MTTQTESRGFLGKRERTEIIGGSHRSAGSRWALAAQCFTYAVRMCHPSWIAGYQPPGLPEEGGVLKQLIGVRSAGLGGCLCLESL
jgi:hypothetical protein